MKQCLAWVFLALILAHPPSSQAAQPAHFHHVHLNVTDVQATTRFYARFFGALPVDYNSQTAALFTERSFIFFNEVETPPRTHLDTALWHLGWAGVDGPSEFRWRQEAGAKVHTPIQALNTDHYMYFQGPDNEVVEVYTGSRNHRFEHVHLLATDVNQTIAWFVDHLGLKSARRNVPPPPTDADEQSLRSIWMNSIRINNVNLIVFGRPRAGTHPFWYPKEATEEIAPTEGSAIDHIAFSYRELEPEYERLKKAGVTIRRPIAKDPKTGIKSFYVIAPDKLLIELVEAKPIPDGLWE